MSEVDDMGVHLSTPAHTSTSRLGRVRLQDLGPRFSNLRKIRGGPAQHTNHRPPYCYLWHLKSLYSCCQTLSCNSRNSPNRGRWCNDHLQFSSVLEALTL